MADPVPPGTVMRVRSTGQPRLYVTQGRQSQGNLLFRAAPKPVLSRTPGLQGPPGPPGGVESQAFSGTGPEFVRVGTHPWVLERTYDLDTVRASVSPTTPPLGSPLIVDVKVNGVSIYGVPAGRPTIAPTTWTALGGAATVTRFYAGNYITVDVVAVGVVQRGSNLVVVIRLTPVSP